MGAKGQPKTGGRVRGVPNKVTQSVAEICAREGYDPLLGQIELCKDPDVSPGIKYKINMDLMQYIYSKLKSGDVISNEESNQILQMLLVNKLNDSKP